MKNTNKIRKTNSNKQTEMKQYKTTKCKHLLLKVTNTKQINNKVI